MSNPYDQFELPSKHIYPDEIPRSYRKYMMATKAFHKLGDISSDEYDICFVYNDDKDNWYGYWVTGFGFINVAFPKDTTRELTPEEINKYAKTYVSISGQPAQKLFD